MEQTTVVRGTPEAGTSSTIGIAGVGTAQATAVIQMPWWQMVGIRFLAVYLESLVAFLTAPALGLDAAIGIPLSQFGNGFVVAASLALGPAVIATLRYLSEIVMKLDVRFPQLRA